MTRQALSGIDAELERHATCHGRMSSTAQLTFIRGQLAQMAEQLSSPPLPPRQQRLRGVGRVIAESWPFDSPLASEIMEAERLYLQA